MCARIAISKASTELAGQENNKICVNKREIAEYWQHHAAHFETRRPAEKFGEHVPIGLSGDDARYTLAGSKVIVMMLSSILQRNARNLATYHFSGVRHEGLFVSERSTYSQGLDLCRFVFFVLRYETNVGPSVEGGMLEPQRCSHATRKILSQDLTYLFFAQVAYSGIWPSIGPFGARLGKMHSQIAGTHFGKGAKFALVEVRGDWKWHREHLGPNQWLGLTFVVVRSGIPTSLGWPALHASERPVSTSKRWKTAATIGLAPEMIRFCRSPSTHASKEGLCLQRRRLVWADRAHG